MIGDREHDIIGAKNCGIQSVGVTFGYALDGELQAAGADYIVDSVEELEDLLERLGR
jgi:phosphoglycolate phosphatase